MDQVTKRTRARRKNRSRREQEGEANVSQVLRMTPEKGSSQNLAAATAMQRARAAAKQYDRHASPEDAETMEEWRRRGAARESIASRASFVSDPSTGQQW